MRRTSPQNFVESGLGGLAEGVEEFVFPEEAVAAEFIRRQQSSGDILTQRGKRHPQPLSGFPNGDEFGVFWILRFWWHALKDIGEFGDPAEQVRALGEYRKAQQRQNDAIRPNRHDRKETERFRGFHYEDLIKRDKVNLDIFWLKDESLEDFANLPAPGIIAQDIMEDLQAALEQFAAIAEDLKEEVQKDY